MHREAYCDDLTCSCHYDANYHEQVTDVLNQPVSEDDIDLALDFLSNEASNDNAQAA